MRIRASRIGAAVGVAVVAALLGVLVWRAIPTDVEFPPELVGQWTTEDPRYAERTFTVDPPRIEFGLGGGESTRHAIESVETRGSDTERIHTVRYRGEDGTSAEVELRLDPGPPPTLRFANHDEVWSKNHRRP